jgi:hypothetical protein
MFRYCLYPPRDTTCESVGDLLSSLTSCPGPPNPNPIFFLPILFFILMSPFAQLHLPTFPPSIDPFWICSHTSLVFLKRFYQHSVLTAQTVATSNLLPLSYFQATKTPPPPAHWGSNYHSLFPPLYPPPLARLSFSYSCCLAPKLQQNLQLL